MPFECCRGGAMILIHRPTQQKVMVTKETLKFWTKMSKRNSYQRIFNRGSFWTILLPQKVVWVERGLNSKTFRTIEHSKGTKRSTNGQKGSLKSWLHIASQDRTAQLFRKTMLNFKSSTKSMTFDIQIKSLWLTKELGKCSCSHFVYGCRQRQAISIRRAGKS